MRTPGLLRADDSPGTLFHRIGADTRAAATEPASQQAFRFLMLALHANETSAHRGGAGTSVRLVGLTTRFIRADRHRDDIRMDRL